MRKELEFRIGCNEVRWAIELHSDDVHDTIGEGTVGIIGRALERYCDMPSKRKVKLLGEIERK